MVAISPPAVATRRSPAPAPAPAPEEITYYGRPAVKSSLYGWMVAIYIFVGGLAGGAQIVATAADLLRGPAAGGVVLAGRVVALAGAILGGILLIADLHTKQRFMNMLRIFRWTSPMSIGTYVLMSFGFFSVLTLAAGLAGLPVMTIVCEIIAALIGLWMTVYTAALLSATATPLWASVPTLLAPRFAASSMGSAAAALWLCAWLAGDTALWPALATLALVALAVDLAFSIFMEWRHRMLGLDAPLRQAPWGPVHVIGVQLLGTALPIALYAVGTWAGGPVVLLSAIASACALGGGLLMRGTILMAGNESARRPQDYFRFARPAAGRP